MISEREAAALAQAYLDANPSKPEQVWVEAINASVTIQPKPLKVHTVRSAAFGYTVTYNTVPPSLAGQRPIHVAADGSDVRRATFREIWAADPSALPHMHADKDEFIAMEEAAIRSGSPWASR